MRKGAAGSEGRRGEEWRQRGVAERGMVWRCTREERFGGGDGRRTEERWYWEGRCGVARGEGNEDVKPASAFWSAKPEPK